VESAGSRRAYDRPGQGDVDERPLARTLAEAYAYLELTMPPGEEWIDFRRYSDLDREGDRYVLRFDGPYEGEHVVREVAVPLDGLSQRSAPLSYGDGVSRLIDAGQWLVIEMAYAAQAQLGQTRAHPLDYGVVARAWESARAAVDEIAKYLPPGADEVPDHAVWTDQGRQARATWPAAFTRVRVAASREEYLRLGTELPHVWPHPIPGADPAPVRAEPPPGLHPGEPLPARTYAEVHAYLDLHPCECGSDQFDRAAFDILEARDTGVVIRFVGVCERCGRPRNVTFRVPDRPGLVPGSRDRFSYAEDGPSRLLDAGEWLGIAEGYGSVADVAVTVADAALDSDRFQPGEHGAAVEYLTSAAWAVDEVLKFVPPGADQLPPEAFWTAESRSRYQAEPAEFSRERLAERRALRWRLVDEFLERYPVGS